MENVYIKSWWQLKYVDELLSIQFLFSWTTETCLWERNSVSWVETKQEICAISKLLLILSKIFTDTTQAVHNLKFNCISVHF